MLVLAWFQPYNGTMRCFAILMAAGLSSRFASGKNENKLMAMFRGKPLIGHTLDLVCAMNCSEGIYVIYHDEAVARFVREAITTAPVRLIYNPAPEKGQGESAILGVKAAVCTGLEPAYYLFMPCDQPMLNADTVRLLLNAARHGCIVEPCGKNSHESNRSPNVFCASLRDELLALKPGEHPRLLKSRHPVITVEVPDPMVLADIDTLDDLAFLEDHS